MDKYRHYDHVEIIAHTKKNVYRSLYPITRVYLEGKESSPAVANQVIALNREYLLSIHL